MADSNGNTPFATGGAFDVLASVEGQASDPLTGRRLGDYDVIETIGRGGMGLVYLGRRADGKFDRDVAIKVSTSGAINPDLLARFRQEQSVLASLNHPNVCQLYDAGVTDESWPYIVMEYVDGGTIVDYCAENQLSESQRVDLLIDVVEAVAYAHRHLIVHRDIKPANVLVSKVGEVKLLDFGIAKLLDSDRELTQSPVLTPRYASPEQLLGQPVTVGSDISQLGLLIYEVLTGKALADSDSLEEAIQRAADRRSLNLTKDLGKDLSPELRSVIELCLRHEASERYADANSLRADLEAYRSGHPLKAAGNTGGYRLRKFVRRNATVVAVLAVAVVGLLSTATWYTFQLREARIDAEQQAVAAQREAEKSNEIADFMVNMFIDATPRTAMGDDVLLRDVIDTGVERIRTELNDKPALKANLLFAIAGMQNDLGFYDQASRLIDESIAVHEQQDLDDPLAYGLSLFRRGILDHETGKLDQAMVPLRQARELFAQVDSETADYWEAMITNTLGMVASQLNDFDTALAYHKEALALRKAHFGENDFQVAASLANLAAIYTKQGLHRQALPYYEQAYEKSVEQLPENDPQIATLGMNVGRAYLLRKQYDKAERVFQKAAEITLDVFGASNPQYSYALLQLGVLEHERGNFPRALELLENSLAIQLEAFGPGNWGGASTKHRIGRIHLASENYDSAMTYFSQADQVTRDAFPNGHRNFAYIGASIAQLLDETGRNDDAIARYQQALADFAATLGEDHPDTIDSKLALGRLLLQRDGIAAATPHYDQALRLLAARQTEVSEIKSHTDPFIDALIESGDTAAAADVSGQIEVFTQQF